MYLNYISSLEKKINDKTITIAIVGLGYVGLPLAMTFAKKGFNVNGYDIDKNKICNLEKKKNYLDGEEWIEDILKSTDTFHASTSSTDAGDNDIIIVAVPTPADPVTKKPIYDYIESAAEDIGKRLKKGSLVILESTLGPGTTEGLFKDTLEKTSGQKAGIDFGLGYSPERVNPGDEKHMIANVPKVVSGIDKKSASVCALIYSKIVPFVHITPKIKEAELTKLLENTQRDINIALINEFAKICDIFNVDIKNVISAASTKWNFYDASPGCGVGGHCLPDDPWFLIHELEKRGYTSDLIKTARKTNDQMPLYTAKKATHLIDKKPNGSKIAFLGLTYKNDISDMRNSPAKTIIEEMKKMGYTNLIAHDPHIGHVDWIKTDTLENTLKDAELVIVTTPHKNIRNLTAKDIKRLAPHASFVDGRNIFNKEKFLEENIRYTGIGR